MTDYTMSVNNGTIRKFSVAMIAGAGVLLCGLLSLLPLLIIKYTAFQASKLVHLVGTLNVGDALIVSDNRLRAFQSYEISSYPYCAGNTSMSYQFINPLLYKMHIAPGNEVDVNLEFEDGKLAYKSVLVLGKPRYGASITQRKSNLCGTIISEPLEHRKVVRAEYSQDFRNVKIFEDESLPTSQIKADWDIDLTCFATFDACSHPEQVLRTGLK